MAIRFCRRWFRALPNWKRNWLAPDWACAQAPGSSARYAGGVEDGTAHIGRLIVAPDMQGKGIGTFLLRAAEAASGADRFALFTGHLSEANLRLYHREGYAVARREQIGPRVELVHLVKAL